MANGDLAAAEAGFTPVKSTDDFRLGYDRINQVADLALLRSMRQFPTQAAMNAVSGFFYGALAAVPSQGSIYYWDTPSTSWKPYFTAWAAYTPTFTGVGASVSVGQYRYVGGMIRYEGSMQASGNSTAKVTASLPKQARQVDMGSGFKSQTGWWAAGRANLFNGNDADCSVGFDSDSLIRFGLTNSSRLIDTIGGAFQLGGGNQLRWMVEYDPA